MIEKEDIFELNGMLTDCIIEVTYDIWDIKITNLFEKVSQKFYEKLLEKTKKIGGNCE